MTKILLMGVFFLTFINSGISQKLSPNQLDSLYYSYLNLMKPELIQKGINIQNIPIKNNENELVKCGTILACAIKRNIKYFSQDKQKILIELLSRPNLDTSIVSPSGFFRIHFNSSGSFVPTYNVEELAIAFDSSYNFEVNYLGYPPPPSDLGAGGDDKYDVYIEGLPFNYYGETIPETTSKNNTCTTFILINNNFSSTYTKGINAARVTAAHEFHHAIQLGNYINRTDSDGFFYEITSTSMEHFVYPSIHDYFQYLPSYFNNTQVCLGKNRGLSEYALAIWNIFLKDNFGYGIIKKQWELMPQMRALQAIANSLADYNTSLGETLNKFGIWTYFTNYRAIPGKYFLSAKEYPAIKPVATLSYSPPSKSVQLYTHPVSNSFIQFVNSSNLDTLVALLTNSDVSKAVDSTQAEIPFGYSLLSQNENGAVKLTSDYYQKFTSDKPAFWVSGEFLNNQVIQIGQYVAENVDYAFPSPFNYNKNAYIYIPAQPDAFGYTDLKIYSVSMKLVFSAHEHVVYISGQKVVRWNGMDKNNSKLSSGVYLYVTKSGNNTSKGKLVIFNN